jgi:hypothetical protein
MNFYADGSTLIRAGQVGQMEYALVGFGSFAAKTNQKLTADAKSWGCAPNPNFWFVLAAKPPKRTRKTSRGGFAAPNPTAGGGLCNSPDQKLRSGAQPQHGTIQGRLFGTQIEEHV